LNKSIKSAIAVALLSLALVACGSDDDADGNTGSNNAPGETTATTETTDSVEGAVVQTEQTPTPRPTLEFTLVSGTPILDAATPRTGSDGSMSTSGTPAASPEASPEDATPESN
jgi:hypothetical protein